MKKEALLTLLLLLLPVKKGWQEPMSAQSNPRFAAHAIGLGANREQGLRSEKSGGAAGARATDSQPPADCAEDRQTDPNAPSVSGLLDYSVFDCLGHINPGGPYPDNRRVWGDLYGYQYDGTDPQYAGKSFAYVGVDVNGSGMTIFDVTEPTEPVHVGTYRTEAFRDVEVHDGIGYFSGRSSTHIVDLRADPVSPPLLKIVAGSHEFNVDNAATGRFLYLDDRGTVPVYDVTTPRAPSTIVLKATLETRGGHSVFAQDGRAYVSNLSEESLAIYDVTDVQNGITPILTEFPTGGGSTHSSWPVGDADYLYITHEAGGTDLRVFDMSGTRIAAGNIDEIMPGRVRNTALNSGFVANVHNLFVVDDLLFTSWTEAGMVLFNIANPSVPRLLGTFDTEATNSGANFNGAFGVYPDLGLDRVLISDRTTGLWIIDVTNVVSGAAEHKLPDSFALLQNWPNPFNQSTTIRFELPEQAAVRLVIYNALGRRLRTLVRGRRGAGSHDLVWRGDDDAGRPLASGTYFLRLEAGGGGGDAENCFAALNVRSIPDFWNLYRPWLDHLVADT